MPSLPVTSPGALSQAVAMSDRPKTAQGFAACLHHYDWQPISRQLLGMKARCKSLCSLEVIRHGHYHGHVDAGWGVTAQSQQVAPCKVLQLHMYNVSKRW